MTHYLVTGDIKTGKFRPNGDGLPLYWIKYPTQLACYRDGVPYNTDTDQRGEPIATHPDVAFIYHYDLDAALNGELVDWQIIPVNLNAGREGGEIAAQHARWAGRSDMFGAPIAPGAAATLTGAGEPTPTPTASGVGVTQTQTTQGEPTCASDCTALGLTATSRSLPTPPTPTDSPPSTSSETTNSTNSPTTSTTPPPPTETFAPPLSSVSATTRPSASPTAQMVAAQAEAERQALRDRKTQMRANAVTLGWGAQFDQQWQAHNIGPHSSNAEIRAALDAIEPPFDHQAPPAVERPAPVELEPTVDNGAPVAASDVDVLIAHIKTSGHVDTVQEWLKAGHRGGNSWDPRTHRDVRRYEITRAALALATASDGNDTVARALLRAVTGGPT